MSKSRITTKAALLAEMEPAWAALNAAIEQLTETQMTTIQDVQGWTVKDHLIHLAAWERGAVFFLQGQPRYEGLGVSEAVYLTEVDDEINAVIQQQTQQLSLAEALSRLRHTHQQLMEALRPLTDTDLQKPYRHYLPDEPGDGDGPPAINVIYGNSAHHFAEHLSWIEALTKHDNG